MIQVVRVVLIFFGGCFAVINCGDLWNPSKCEKGCRSDDKCPKNAECYFFDDTDQTCGVCRCISGFEQKGASNKCVEQSNGGSGSGAAKNIKNKRTSTSTPTTSTTSTSTITSTTSTSTSTTSPTTTTVTSTTTPTTTTGIPTQGPPPSPQPLDCVAYDCGVSVQQSDDSDPTKIRTQHAGTPPPGCKRLIGGSRVVCKSPLPDGSNQCFGQYCLPVSDAKSYCICPPHKNGPSCHEDKNGQCASGNGQVTPKGFTLKDTKFVNKNDPDSGSIWSRHIASNLSDCIKLCQWDKACRAVNFGQLGGQNVCELLTIQFTPGSGNPLETWMLKAPGWTFVCLL